MIEALKSIQDGLTTVINVATDYLYGYILVYLLIGVGLGLTVYLGVPQIRHVGAIFKSMTGSRQGADGGISSFQAFAVGVATRVGIGNIGGVALALVIGGPGAIFWMWVVAAIGMATSFTESTLAQIFKVRHEDGSFRGGPAQYISRGLNWKITAKVFAVIAIVSSGLSVPMVQINTVAATMQESHGVPAWITGLAVMALIAPVIIGGVRWVARVSEYLMPFMAGIYLLVTIVVIIGNLPAAGNAILAIVANAFGIQAGLGGVVGSVFAALINGARRGLFSNEAGLGTAPNAAGSATTSHPVNQGFIQALGVFVDTMIVCTCTALLILISGVFEFGTTEASQAGYLTANAVKTSLGAWMAIPMSLIVFIFGFTSAFGAYSYGQVALDHLTKNKVVSYAFRLAAVLVCGLGAVMQLTTVWTLADLLLGLGALINLVALVFLAKWVKGALRDWHSQRREKGVDPVFIGNDNDYLPADVPGDVWAAASEAETPKAEATETKASAS